MAEKRMVNDDNIGEDRISDLPIDLMNCILERLGFRELARASVLSKKWRNIWTTYPKLVLDKQFFNTQWSPSKFEKTINDILQGRTILEFVNIYIPFSQSPYMDLWIPFLSRNGIKELTLDNAYSLQPYILPSDHIFSCAKLTYLKLCNCIISNPPGVAFDGFRNLNKLSFERVSLPPFFGALLISGLPVLKVLALRDCSGVRYMKKVPPKLIRFIVKNSHEFKWRCLENNLNQTQLSVALCKEFRNWEESKEFKFMLLGIWPRIKKLYLDGPSLQFLSAGNVSNFQPVLKLDGLNYLKLNSFGFSITDQILCAFCLIRSSPNLRILEIEVSRAINDVFLANMEAPAGYLGETLNQLETVKLTSLNGLRAELIFIKLILAHSPLLKRMMIDFKSGLDAEEESRFSRELMQFPRASARAKIVNLNPKMTTQSLWFTLKELLPFCIFWTFTLLSNLRKKQAI